MSTKVIQVTNIAPQATKDQMQNLFGCIGKIDEIRLYPTVRDVTCPVLSRICYVKFFESSCVAVAQHLTNTVFIDRALIVCPVSTGQIPDEFKALEITNNGAAVPGLHTPETNLPPEVVNRIEGIHPFQVVKTSDPKLEEHGLPEYPALPVSFDARKIEEIRRTVIVIDIPADWELDEILTHFAQAGEVKYARFAEKNRQKYVMIEFCEQKSVIEALKMQGSEFMGKRLNIFHSMQSIIKPEAKSNEAAQREIEEAMSIVKEAQNMISAAIDPVIGILSSKEKSVRRTRSRTRSRSRRSRSHSKRSRSRKRSKRSRSRSRSKRKRSRSRSRSRRRSASRTKSKRSRSRSKRPRSRDRERRKRSRSRRRSRSVSRRRSRSRSRERKRSRSPHGSRRKTSRKEEKRTRRSRSRSKSRSRRHSKSRSTHTKESSSSRHRDREKDTDRDRDRDREKEREKDKDRGRDRERIRERSKERKSKRASEDKPRERDYDAEEKIGSEELKKDSSDDASPEKSDNMDISNSP